MSAFETFHLPREESESKDPKVFRDFYYREYDTNRIILFEFVMRGIQRARITRDSTGNFRKVSNSGMPLEVTEDDKAFFHFVREKAVKSGGK